MSEIEIQRERWRKVLHALRGEGKSFCAVGGGAIWLYLKDLKKVSSVRPTDDIDLIVPSKTKAEYYDLDKRLRKLGFKNDIRQGAPLCRYTYQDVVIDFMPVSEDVLNLKNRWFLGGWEKKKIVDVDGNKTGLFPLPYFLASKFEAFQDRGASDPRFSRDLEDICIIVDSLEDFENELFKEADENVSGYLREQMKEFSTDKKMKEAVYGHLGDEKGDRFFNRIKDFVT